MKKEVWLCFLMAYLLTSCTILRTGGKCNVVDLLLTKDDFPAETIVGHLSSPIDEMPEESAGFSASYGGNLIYQDVGRFPTTAIAEKEFEGTKSRSSIQTELDGPWETPPELSYVSSIFQKYYVTCGKIQPGDEYQCRMMGQYDQYSMYFFAYVSDEGMTLDIVNDLLKKIDSRMEQCLGE